MFLSKLTLDPLDRNVRRDVRNAYDLHRTVLRAFPDAADGGPGKVLFRLEPGRAGEPVVLVQSEKEPRWDRLPAGYAVIDGPKSLADVAFRVGQRLRFRLRANPTKRVRAVAGGESSFVGKRVGLVHEADQEAWLRRKADAGGFRILGVRTVPESEGRAWKPGFDLAFVAVRFDGLLEVADPAAFRHTLVAGVGSAKGLGFGLLSVAPA
jgi:CRISPR system Cascade subunit CasE